MKSVLISIKPEWCDLVATGKKSVEIRKTAPKLETPFKVYIYCTKGNSQFSEGDRFCLYTPPHDTPVNANQAVIGEFVCNKIEHIEIRHFTVLGHENRYAAIGDNPDNQWLQKSCLSYDDVAHYGRNAPLFGWNISQLKLYDRPRYLGRFVVPSRIGCCNEGKCRGCQFFIRGNAMAGIEADCMATFNTDEYKPLRRPPQSWCYVEESGL